VGLGSFDTRWSALSVLRRAVARDVPRVSLASNLDDDSTPSAVDIAQAQMLRRAASALEVTVDYQVFVGRDGYGELSPSRGVVTHTWRDAPQPDRWIPEVFGVVRHVQPGPPRLAAALCNHVRTVDDCEGLARALLRADERIALAVLHADESGDVTGVFPIGSNERLDERAPDLAFRAGFRGFCHRVLVVAGGAGDRDWEGRLERHLGPKFLAWLEECCFLPSVTMLVGPDGRRFWGGLGGRSSRLPQ
jgi:hypothetical protein